MRPSILALSLAALLFGAGCVPGARPAPPPVATAPPGADALAGVSWIRVPGPAGSTLVTAVARPSMPGPHPVLVLLHGTHGFAREYVTLARDLAREADVVAVAPCWFAGRRGASVAVVTPIECAGAPPMPDSSNTPAALGVVRAVIDAARRLPGVRTDQVVLLGHSRGAAAALHVALEHGGSRPAGALGLRAIVLNDGPYPPSFIARVPDLRVPVLLLHGTADAAPGAPPDGGSEMTRVERARAFEAAVQAAGRPIEAEYFEGANHVGLFTSTEQRARILRRVTAFLRANGIG